MGLWTYTDDCDQAVDHWSGRPEAPNAWSRQRPEGIPLYRTPFVERFFGRAHPITPILWFGPLISYGLYTGFAAGRPGATLGWFAAGVLIWTLFEYLLHRFLFHLIPRTDQAKRSAFLMHGYHHEFPRDPMRLVAPPVMSWPLGALFAVAYYLLLGAPDCWQLYAGTAAGYVAYDWIHFYTHHFRPRRGIGRWIRRYHLSHHFRDKTSHFGISSPLWDLVFGTFRANQRKPSSQAASTPTTAR
ncbi:MAG: sterol desaturase family protein [Deltaproteobacteria bacterium]|jgi:sterol desaturase/sphingolipid hydroxylase (fatty acid hydroxylase superfamily)|nr:sterol desaturase family protein [Deltaproteobacteria bacterium]MBW2535276.1 sterol desaturase family protein [Deltaproteobacteria bacterium]